MSAIVARGICTPFGEGEEVFGRVVAGEAPESRVRTDEELVRAKLERPFCARVSFDVPAGVDRATALLDRAMAMCAAELDLAIPDWRKLRVGAAIGTSSGGMRSFEDVFASDAAPTDEQVLAAMYIGPVAQCARPTTFEPFAFVLGACASSTLAIGVGRTWLEQDRCDIALCGGFDAVGVFVAAGFECLRATSGPRGPQPFRAGRDGLALGEGAALVALVREPERFGNPRVHGWVTGFGATCDAAHLTAPDGSGAGLARAATAALERAGLPEIGLVSAHGTATRQNDSAEAKAIVSALGARSASIPTYSLKGAVGHTLGAAGALEVVSAVTALSAEIAPASVGEGPAEPGVRVLDRAEPSTARSALKLSSAFGGANAALVLGRDRPGTRALATARAPVFVSRAVFVGEDPLATVAEIAARTGYGADRLTRADGLVRLAIAATAALEDDLGAFVRGAGIIVGHGLATLETNAQFLSRIRSAGAARGEPRRFAYTTPNAAAGECAVAFGLTGPAFAVGGGAHGGIEALSVAADLVREGAAERIVVVAVDEVGPATTRLARGASIDNLTSGAVAMLVAAAPVAGGGRLESSSVRLARGRAYGHSGADFSAHAALLPLTLREERPSRIAVDVPWGPIAEATFFWL